MKIRIEYEQPAYEFAYCALASLVYDCDFDLPTVSSVKSLSYKHLVQRVHEGMTNHGNCTKARIWLSDLINNGRLNYSEYSVVYEAIKEKLQDGYINP